MQTVTELNQASKNRRHEAAARKDCDGQEKIIELDELRKALPVLTQDYATYAQAKVVLNESIKATAERAGLLSSVVRKLVVSRASDKTIDDKRKAQQMSLVFEEIGE